MRSRPFVAAVVVLALALGLVVFARDGDDDRRLVAVKPLAVSQERRTSSDRTSGRSAVVRATGASRVVPASRAPEDAPSERLERERPAKKAADPDTVLVRFDDGTTAQQRRAAAADAGVRIVRDIPQIDLAVVALGDESREEVTERMAADRRVEAVDANRIRHISADPFDELYAYQYHLFTSRLPAAWDVTKGSSVIDIAILDTGINASHPDLAPRIGAKTDIVGGDSVPEDVNGHGTFVAGVAAAQTDNATGVAGVAWNARIMPVKVMGDDGSGNDGDIANGIVWAADNGAEVINLSLGGPGDSPALSSAVAYANSKGAVVVAASGNEGTDQVNTPASIPSVIAVGATDPFGDVAPFSTRGEWVDVVANGVAVTSTCLCGDGYGTADGTSFSTPVVSGVAALVRTKFPTLSPGQIASRIRSTAIDRGPAGIDDFYGAGLVDAYAAVGGKTAASPPPAVRDAFEPDDVPDRARAIVADQEVTISPEGDVDWYYVDAPADGRLTVTIVPPVGAGALEIPAEVTAWGPQLGSLPDLDAFRVSHDAIEVRVASGERSYFRVAGTATSANDLPYKPRYAVTSVFVPEVGDVTPGDTAWIRSTSPADFATGAATSVHPTVTFGRDIAPASIDATTVRLINVSTGADIAATRTYNAATKTVTITPSSALAAGRPYVVRVSGVTDASSNTMDERYVTRFTVTKPAVSDLDSDFNKDGFEDVVIAAPSEDAGSLKDTGVVHVLYGSSAGAKGNGSQMWSQDSSGVPDKAEAGDKFGGAVATGDVNNDGFDDLLVGVPGEDVGTIKDAGAVHVLLGSSTGLRGPGQLWTQNSPGVPGAAETSDRFGGSLAVGAFDGVAGDDAAIGSPTEAVGSFASAGAVHVMRGGSSGLTATAATQWTQDSAGIEFFAEAGDQFGASLAAGDFEGDGNDDLAIGAPSDDIAPTGNEGTVVVMRGSVVGARPGMLLADFLDVADEPEAGDRFGASVAIGDFGGMAATDPYAELVIGIPGQFVSAARAGVVNVLWSDHSGPGLGFIRLNQSSTLESNAEADGAFGSSVAVQGGVIAVGVPGDDLGSVGLAGGVALLKAQAPSSDGFGGFEPSSVLSSSRAHLTQDSPGVPGGAESGDRFGSVVSFADTNGDRVADLIASAPDEGLGSATTAGAVYVARDPLGTPAYQLFTQNTSGVGSAAESGDRLGSPLG